MASTAAASRSLQPEDVPTLVNQVRQAWVTHQQLMEYERKKFVFSQLRGLKQLIEQNKEKIIEAVKEDLRKSDEEAYITEIIAVLHDVNLLIRDYYDLVKARPIKKNLMSISDDLYLKPEPYGVMLIIGPWNYPFQLIAQPLAGAIAAGNAVVIKPSELSVNTSNIFTTLIPEYLDKDFYKVIPGDVSVSQAVIKERFDYIMYTGSTNVGKIVMAEAAKNLTPVTLELGGKSPVIITNDADLKLAASRIMWAKLLNSGQTCIAPDYVLLTSSDMRDTFVEYCKDPITAMFGDDPLQSDYYGRIINERHFERITKLMANSKGRNVLSGYHEINERYIAPAIFVDVTGDDPLMQEELFGPVLPVLTVYGLDEAIKFVNKREKPLALYVFTETKAVFNRVVNSTSSGSITQNNVIVQIATPLPLGGVGHSGMGRYHGHYSFETFSHMKPVMKSCTKESIQRLLYPPYMKSLPKIMEFIYLPSTTNWDRVLKPLIVTCLVVIVAIALSRII